MIKNLSELIPPYLDSILLDLRRTALEALKIAIEEVKPFNLLKSKIIFKKSNLVINGTKFDLNKYNKVYIIGGGKACYHMASYLVELFKKIDYQSYEGIINIPKGLEIGKNHILGNIKINTASHPIPDKAGLRGTKRMMRLVKSAKFNDLVICLISGGGSALLPLPKAKLSLQDLKKVNELLLSSGASIQEINAIRKHLSDFKGGNLAKANYEHGNSTLISLIISDVIGDDLDSIASGPTVPDSSTFLDVERITQKYNLVGKLPDSVQKVIEEGLRGNLSENPKLSDYCFLKVSNFLIGSVKSAISKIEEFLLNKSFIVNHFPENIVGEARLFGESLVNYILKQVMNSNQEGQKNKIAIIGSGELTVTLLGIGIGGRNQEMLLSFLNKIASKKLNFSFSIIAANLDGIEGNSKAMGALIDNSIKDKILKNEIALKQYLDNNDSNSFFKAEKLEIISGPTGVNVNDILIALIQMK